MSSFRALGASLIALMALCSPNGHADSNPSSIVYPTGIYPDDVNRVQAALNLGGTVLLKAGTAAGVPTPFNFGTGLADGQSGGVFLNKDVSIIGENVQSHRTTILGGFLPIQGLVPVKSAIQGIDFENSIGQSITIGASTGSVITDNIIHNVVPVSVRVPSGRIITNAEGILFAGYDSSGPAPGLITGNVVVARNTINGATAIFSNGIQFDSFSANTQIAGNNISNVNDDTTETGSGILVIRAQNRVTIASNVIAPGPAQNVGVDGIFIDGDRGARYLVIGNTIRTIAPFANGIDIVGGSATGTTGTVQAKVVANSVGVSDASAAGIFLWDLVTESQITANSIQGAGIIALGISTYGFETNTASLNRFVGNDLRNFISNQADLFYDANTQNNEEIGFCRSVIDLGVGNSSNCGASASFGALGLVAPNALSDAGASAPRQVLATKQQQLQLQHAFGRITAEQVLR
jgi:hypothetical protein